MESKLSDKDLEIPVNTMLNMSKQSTLAAKKTHGILGSVRKSVATGLKEVILSLFSA